MFYGEYEHSIDKKGRLIIPSNFRDSLKEYDIEKCYITRGLDKCLFLFTEKFLVDLLGKNEYALRLFPLIAGIASIFLFWKLSERVLHKAVVPIAMLFFVSSRSLLYYSCEVKPYSTDVFFTLVILLFAINSMSEKRSWPFICR